MNKNTQTIRDDISALGEDARTLLADTAGMTGEKVAEVRQRLTAALESAKETFGDLQDKAVKGAKAADGVIRDNPYQAIGIAFGVGALVGFLLTHQSSRRS